MSTRKKEIFFYAVDSVQELFENFKDTNQTSDTYLSVYFRKDSKFQIYDRRVQNIYDWLAYIGGFWKSIFAVGVLMSSLMGYNIFVSSIMRRLYYFDDENSDSEQNQV